MSKTRHIQTRMKERGISQLMLDIVTSCGELEKNGERITLSRKSVKKVIDRFRCTLKELEAMERLGGITVVKFDDRLITTFTVDSYIRG